MKKALIAILVIGVLLLSIPAAVFAADPPQKPITPAELKHITFVHYAKPDNPGKPPKEEPQSEGSYKLLGFYIQGTAEYHVNISNFPNEFLTELNTSFNTWDTEVSQTLFSYGGSTSVSGSKYDGFNTVSWARIAPKTIIAITNVWYSSDDDPMTLDPILEFDIVFNSFLPWGIDSSGAYDVQNIATHEIGHAVGLGDLYSDDNNIMTMYGYGSIGETQKRDLAYGDIEGINAIYQ